MKTIVLFGCVLGVLCAEGKVFRTKLGHSVTMECGVNAFSSSLKWEREGTLVQSILQRFGMPVKGSGSTDVAKRSKLKQNTNLEINPVKPEDAGPFTCTADKTPHEHRLVVVSVSPWPSADLLLGSSTQLHCQVYGLTSGSVQWKRPNGRQEQSQTVKLAPVSRADEGTWECIYAIDGEPQTESLVVRVTEPTPSTTTLLHPKIPKGHRTPNSTKPWLDLQWWVWVAVGVGGLVVILLIISIIVMYKRIKRRKKRLLQMKNANQMKPKQYCQCRHQRPTAAAKTQQGRRREKPSALPLQPLLTQ
ncbi:uncharacterized protein LOC115435368 isoform X2 [Sphaeramia orbicularis]|uniref:uncharacterized protein LOC115435368 isoform X2 n=1 Tax=Sphaeramia orbicularis TaxID=375764 RepID=UPI00117E8748|nr:uncharacterized protein LOC115435368 isoform X2 [Sphaeramia orbicularis]